MLLPAKTAAPIDVSDLPGLRCLNAAAECDVALFVAPPGYLVLEALAAALRARHGAVIWLRLGAEDRDPAMLLYSLGRAAQPMAPAIWPAVQLLLRQPPDARLGWRAAWSALGAELVARLPSGCAVVIEQLDCLEQSQSLELLTGVLLPALAGRHPCVLLASREPAALVLPPHALRHDVASLRLAAADLADMVAATGVRLPDRLLRRALRLLGGQADGLYSLLRMLGGLERAPADDLVGHAASADDLLARSARLQLECDQQQTRQILALSARLGAYHPELGAALGVDARPAPAWLVPLSGGWLRLRGAWQPVLPWLVRAGDGASRDTLAGAADYLAEREMLVAAVPLYLELDAHDRAAEALSRSLDTLMGLGQHGTLGRWLGQIPTATLQRWPWLVYAQGELATLQRETERARRSFAAATASFEARDDSAGACQSLLAESTLLSWQGQYGQAGNRTLIALARAEAAGLTWHLGWAAWQLVGLALVSGEHSLAMVYLDRALSAANAAGEQAMAELLRPLEALMVRYRELGEQREYHRQAYLAAEQAGLALHEQLRELVRTPLQGDAPVSATYPWTATPLMLRLSSPAASTPAPGRPGARLWQSFLHALGVEREQAQPALPAPPPAEAGEPPWRAAPVATAQLVRSVASPAPAAARAIPLSAPAAAVASLPTPIAAPAPALWASLLGPFRLSIGEVSIESWPSGRGRSLLKYLLLHRAQPVPRDVLMDLFWPEASPEDARNSLNVALHGLRQALRVATPLPIVEFRRGDASYRLNPALSVWIDVEEFERTLQAGRAHEASGQLVAAVAAYEQAAALYQGDFMADDPYDDWPVLRREQLRLAHLDVLERLAQIAFSQGQYGACAGICQRILARDNCREDVHCRLMRCYSRQGQQHLALRQYQACLKALADEIGVEPLASTRLLADQIRRREQV